MRYTSISLLQDIGIFDRTKHHHHHKMKGNPIFMCVSFQQVYKITVRLFSKQFHTTLLPSELMKAIDLNTPDKHFLSLQK
jgi:hypothetical protein